MGSNEDIKNAFAEWTRSWNQGDIEGYLKAYADTEKVRYVSGSKIVRGKQAIAALFRQRGASGFLKIVEDLDIEVIGISDAIVFGQFEVAVGSDDAQRGVFTVHLGLLDGAWRILSDHSSA